MKESILSSRISEAEDSCIAIGLYANFGISVFAFSFTLLSVADISGGVAAGFVLYVATKLVSDLGGSGLLSAPIAAWSPALVGSMLGTLVLLHQEDG